MAFWATPWRERPNGTQELIVRSKKKPPKSSRISHVSRRRPTRHQRWVLNATPRPGHLLSTPSCTRAAAHDVTILHAAKLTGFGVFWRMLLVRPLAIQLLEAPQGKGETLRAISNTLVLHLGNQKMF